MVSKMRRIRLHRWLGFALGGAVLVQIGGCLGPNPGFFIGTSAANATISTLISTFINNLLSSGGA